MSVNLQATVLISLLTLSGCASITKDSHQGVKIETYSNQNVMIEGVKCTAKNERGEWSSMSPGAIVVHRSGDNLSVNCEKQGEPSGYATVISRANGGMFGNILFGGGIGAIIDHNNGKAYSYPDWIRVIMGDNLVYDRKNHKDNEVTLGKAASPEELKKIADAKAAEEKAALEQAAQQENAKLDTSGQNAQTETEKTSNQ